MASMASMAIEYSPEARNPHWEASSFLASTGPCSDRRRRMLSSVVLIVLGLYTVGVVCMGPLYAVRT